jgi:hypothetical protein
VCVLIRFDIFFVTFFFVANQWWWGPFLGNGLSKHVCVSARVKAAARTQQPSLPLAAARRFRAYAGSFFI